MILRRSLQDGVVVLSVEGTDALDTACAAAFKHAAVEAIPEGGDVVVDLGGLEFVDSAGVGAFVGLYKAARARGARLRFAGARPGVRSVLELIRLHRILEVSDEVAGAARELRDRRRLEGGIN
ncbi:MAG TPA: STAS domain-containing protein [Candidatus Polarisedimenticolaceae bacterium]|nr:STAS domain-containing protein [Candidatus Polarisedimenticolaceae bacterium]